MISTHSCRNFFASGMNKHQRAKPVELSILPTSRLSPRPIELCKTNLMIRNTRYDSPKTCSRWKTCFGKSLTIPEFSVLFPSSVGTPWPRPSAIFGASSRSHLKRFVQRCPQRRRKSSRQAIVLDGSLNRPGETNAQWTIWQSSLPSIVGCSAVW